MRTAVKVAVKDKGKGKNGGVMEGGGRGTTWVAEGKVGRSGRMEKWGGRGRYQADEDSIFHIMQHLTQILVTHPFWMIVSDHKRSV